MVWRRDAPLSAGVLTSSCTAVSRVFAVPKQQVTRAKLANVAKHSARPVVGILPTGWAATGGCGVPPGASGGGGGFGGGGGRKLFAVSSAAAAAAAAAKATANAEANAAAKKRRVVSGDERALAAAGSGADAAGAAAAAAAAAGGAAGSGGAAAPKFPPPSAGRVDDAPRIHAVPYSLHAPHAELEALVAALRPTAVVGVNVSFIIHIQRRLVSNS